MFAHWATCFDHLDWTLCISIVTKTPSKKRTIVSMDSKDNADWLATAIVQTMIVDESMSKTVNTFATMNWCKMAHSIKFILIFTSLSLALCAESKLASILTKFILSFDKIRSQGTDTWSTLKFHQVTGRFSTPILTCSFQMELPKITWDSMIHSSTRKPTVWASCSPDLTMISITWRMCLCSTDHSTDLLKG